MKIYFTDIFNIPVSISVCTFKPRLAWKRTSLSDKSHLINDDIFVRREYSVFLWICSFSHIADVEEQQEIYSLNVGRKSVPCSLSYS